MSNQAEYKQIKSIDKDDDSIKGQLGIQLSINDGNPDEEENVNMDKDIALNADFNADGVKEDEKTKSIHFTANSKYLGRSYPSTFTIDGIQYKSCEHYINEQYEKYKNDPNEWNKRKEDIVFRCNQTKFDKKEGKEYVLQKYLLEFEKTWKFIEEPLKDDILLKDKKDDQSDKKDEKYDQSDKEKDKKNDKPDKEKDKKDKRDFTNLFGKSLTKLRDKIYYKQAKHCWFSCNIQLNDFNVQSQSYDIEGYINVFWKWPNKYKLKKIGFLVHNYMFDKENNFKKGNDNLEYFKVGNKKDMNGFYNKIVKIRNLLDKEKGSAVKFNNKFPIDPRKVFDSKSLIDLEHLEDPVFHYNCATGASHIQFQFRATLFESLELFSFPFDYQFLNIKFAWNSKGGNFKLIQPNDDKGQLYDVKDPKDKSKTIKSRKNGEIDPNHEIFKMLLDLPRGDNMQGYCNNYATITVKETVSSEIDMESPWIYYNHEEGMHWLRLRLTRKEGYIVLTSIFPLFLVVITIFCTFIQEDNDNALNYAITVLLTFAATQSVINEFLPPIAELLFVDYYILFGYIVITLVILWSVFKYESISDNFNNINNEVFIWVIVAIWLFITLLYIILWIKVSFCKKYSCLPCCSAQTLQKWSSFFVCKYLYELATDWTIRADEEVDGYLNYSKEGSIKLILNDENINKIGDGYAKTKKATDDSIIKQATMVH